MELPKNGYAWWYVDGLSDDGRHGVTLIGFLGSVFSPYYAWARRSRPAEPLTHCAINVVLYGGGRKRWAMTERGRSAVFRSSRTMDIGPSSLTWEDGRLDARIDEVTAPLPSRLRGTVRLTPASPAGFSTALDEGRKHHWCPIAPIARIEVDLVKPRLRWRGNGYFDTNWGLAPLEETFRHWHWSRAHTPEGGAIVLYDTVSRASAHRVLALQFSPQGKHREFRAPDETNLSRTLWRIPRVTHAEGGQAEVLKTLEDAPFYARSLIRTNLMGHSLVAVHESLSLRRFDTAWVRCLLPFRMPRAILRRY